MQKLHSKGKTNVRSPSISSEPAISYALFLADIKVTKVKLQSLNTINKLAAFRMHSYTQVQVHVAFCTRHTCLQGLLPLFNQTYFPTERNAAVPNSAFAPTQKRCDSMSVDVDLGHRTEHEKWVSSISPLTSLPFPFTADSDVLCAGYHAYYTLALAVPLCE